VTIGHLSGWASSTTGNSGHKWNVSVAKNGGSSIGNCDFGGQQANCSAAVTSTSFAAGDTVTFTITDTMGNNSRLSVAVGS
jgi:hypothetical protein